MSGRQHANGSVLCDIKRASALLILLYRAAELCEAVLTAPDRPHSQPPGPSLLGPCSLSLFPFWACERGPLCEAHSCPQAAHHQSCSPCSSCFLLLPPESRQMQSQPRTGCHHSPSWVRGEWSVAAASALGCCRQRLLHSTHVSPPHLSPEELESLWEPDQASMEAEENRGGSGGELITHKAKRQERKRQELLALALGVKLGSKGALLWKPIKLLASCPQISSPLVRRSALKDTQEKQCSYEKIHNFKVSVIFVQFLSPSRTKMFSAGFFFFSQQFSHPWERCIYRCVFPSDVCSSHHRQECVCVCVCARVCACCCDENTRSWHPNVLRGD